MKTEIPKASTIDQGNTTGVASATMSGSPAVAVGNTSSNTPRNCTNSHGHPSPARIPASPPMVVNTVTSVRNCLTMSDRVAPSARRTPISRVRSVIVANMMFMIPIPPTKSEMNAIRPMKIMNIRRVARACSSSSRGVITA